MVYNTRESYQVGLAVLLSAILVDTQAHRPLADALAQNDCLLFQSQGKDPGLDLMASYAAAFADGKASS